MFRLIRTAGGRTAGSRITLAGVESPLLVVSLADACRCPGESNRAVELG
jgi:hypothetical protein